MDNDTNLGSRVNVNPFMKARIFCKREVPPGRQFASTVDFQYQAIYCKCIVYRILDP